MDSKHLFEKIRNKQITYKEFKTLTIPWISMEPHVFWAGFEGKKRARQETCVVPDDQVPVVNLIFKELKKIRDETGKHDPFMTQVSFWTSKIFAKTTVKYAILFISQDKSTEEPGYTTGTNLWEAELPILQKLIRIGRIIDVYVHLYRNNRWEGPFSLKEDEIDLPIWRRYHHPLDDPSTKPSFVEQHYEQKDFDHWRTQPPRKPIKLSKLRKIANKWRRIAKSKTSP